MKAVSLLLASLLACDMPGFAAQERSPAKTSQVQTQEASHTAKIKARVQKRGIGEKVTVKLVNGTEVKGRITKIEESSFAVTNHKTGHTTDIFYADVQKIRGAGWSKSATIAVVAVSAGVIAVSLIGYCVGTQSC